MKPMTPERGKTFQISVLIAALMATFWHLPYLLCPLYPNTDHSLVGLQALRFLDGEWSWLTWGISYQASLEAVITAVWFRLFGISASGLVATTFLGRLIVLFVFAYLLSRKFSLGKTLLLLFLVIPGSESFMKLALYPPRQWCFTFVALSILFVWISSIKRHWAYSFLAIFCALFSLYVDYYAIQFLPALLLLIWLERPSATREFLFGSAAGLLIGALFLIWMRSIGPASGPPLAFNPARLITHAGVFWSLCLPVMLGISKESGVVPWWQVLGGSLLILLYGWGFLSIVKVGDRTVRSWGIFAGLTVITSSVGFIGSSMTGNITSTRYLIPLIWVAPFAVAPLGYRLATRKLAILVAPVLFAFFTANVSAPEFSLEYGKETAQNEQRLFQTLSEKGVTAAEAPYWDAYRLMLQFSGEIVVIPMGGGNRYPPFAEQFQNSQRRAKILPASQGAESWSDARRGCMGCEVIELEDYLVLIRN